jgi:hypothetical protein
MFGAIVINRVQQHVGVDLKVGHVERLVRNYYLVNSIDVNRYYCVVDWRGIMVEFRFVMLENVYHVKKQVFERVNVEKQKLYEIVMNWFFNAIK